MGSSPLVSVVMPAYNSAQSILASVYSVLNQTYQNIELIIVDDCSTDGTLDVLESIVDPRVKVYKLITNSGSPAAPRNKALELATGQYISFLDSDDLWKPEKVQRQLAFMQESGSLFACTAYRVIDSRGVQVASYSPPEKVGYKQLLSNNSVGCLTAMLHKSLLEDRSFPKCGHEDFALWLSILKDGNFVDGINENLATYRLVNGSVSSNKFKLISFFWNIYRNEQGFSWLKSLYYCIKYLINVVWFKYK
ncbi:glycosyltransferase family 2 protein [Vibrio sp. D404a]|uniref:glycosyltransferase family 2 protein n=1 Tax=unclassified Vibrio TaxID=2614977 RepID=UPI0025541736|nr:MULTISPECIES: glycosyltransferase family 2 protein [unclassified Vibrio]MDK9737700.1 glycosyltransferase family 2 protein [Vibrio sp. D404a]MDK9795302.1 glycosyltransferase family 2 protein [Vibrio sp. D449a]